MDKTKKISILFYILFFQIIGYSQTVDFDTARCFQVADSIILANTNDLFLNNLIRKKDIYKSEMIRLNSLSDFNKELDDEYREKNKVIEYHITYKIKNDYNCHILHKTGSMGPTWITIILDTNYICNEELHFIDEYLAVNERLQTLEPITKNEAELVAIENYGKGMHKSYIAPLLIYDAKKDLFYWRFEVQKGLRNVTQEQLFINAENGKFEFKITNNYKQSIWQAIFW